MMKITFAVLAVLAVSSPLEAYQIPRTGNGALADELQAFADIIPVHEIATIILEYAAEDTQFQDFLNYMQTEDFRTLIKDFENMPEVKDLLVYVQGAGVDVYYLVNKANKYLGLPELTPAKVARTFAITGGIRGLLDDIEAIFPVEKIRALYKEKMTTSTVFADFMAHLRSPAMETVAQRLCANVHFQNLITVAKKNGVDTNSLQRILGHIFGFTVPCVN